MVIMDFFIESFNFNVDFLFEFFIEWIFNCGIELKLILWFCIFKEGDVDNGDIDDGDIDDGDMDDGNIDVGDLGGGEKMDGFGNGLLLLLWIWMNVKFEG